MSTTDIYKYVHGETYTAEKIPQPIAGTGFVDVVGPDGITPLAFSAIALFDDAVGTTELTIDVDFEVGSEDARYTALESESVYRSIRILNAAYQSAVFYVDASVVGGYAIYNPYPVGSFYTQYPDADSSVLATAFPDASRPADMFGGTWVAQWDDEGIDFHTEGYDTTVHGASADRADGLQLDNMQRITGTLSGGQESLGGTGAFSGGDAGASLRPSNGSASTRGLNFNSADSPDARVSQTTAGRTTDRNRLVRIYKRTA